MLATLSQKQKKIKDVMELYEKHRSGRTSYSPEDIENHLNEILPIYWEVFHENNINRQKAGETPCPGDDKDLLPCYDIGIFLVGYSSLPIVLSLAEIRPTEKIYFLYSKDTEDILKEIKDRLKAMLNGKHDEFSQLVENAAGTQISAKLDAEDKELIRMELFQEHQSGFSLEIGDPSDPVATFKRIKEIVDSIDESDNKRIALDLTGGKKTMLGGGYTAGTIWASRLSAEAQKNLPFCDMYYIDSKKYDPSSGRPDPGTEFLSRLKNPYDVYNVQSNLEAHKLFEKYNYEAAADLWKDVEGKLKDHALRYGLEAEQKAVQTDLAMANCYKLWDDFAYKEAKAYMGVSGSSITGFWGYQEKHTNDSIDVLDILSEVTNRAKLFADDQTIIHYAVDRYQNAVRRQKSGKLYDAIVRFTQVIEMLCNYKIRLIARRRKLVNEAGNLVSNVSAKLKITPLIRFLFGAPCYRKYYIDSGFYKISDSNERLDINHYIYDDIESIIELIDARNDFVHFVEELEIGKAKEVTKQLQKLARKFIENFSENYRCSQNMDLDDLLALHTFRETSLPPAEQFVNELRSLGNSPSDEGHAMQIYNDKLQTFDGEKQNLIAQALRDYWQGIEKWEGKSLTDKQGEKVQTLKSILERSNK